MAHPIVPAITQTTVETHVWHQEHAWLHCVFKSPCNTLPKFRFPDLLAGCISLVLGTSEAHIRLVEFMVVTLPARDPASKRRSCEVWVAQFDQLMAFHRGPLNRFPNPRFDLDHIVTGCVALAGQQPFGEAAVLLEARRNLRARVNTAREATSRLPC
jgi:hypothetical protein